MEYDFIISSRTPILQTFAHSEIYTYQYQLLFKTSSSMLQATRNAVQVNIFDDCAAFEPSL